MSTVLVATPSNAALWAELLQRACPGRTISFYDKTAPLARSTDDLILWKPDQDLFEHVVVRRSIFCLGAGVDAILALPNLPRTVDLFRLVDTGMAPQMAAWCSYAVLHFFRDMDAYQDSQREKRWHPLPYRAPADFPVGILGAGTLGIAVARALSGFGIPVTGWRRTASGQATDFPCVYGPEGLHTLLANSMAVICLLPLTPKTRGLIDAGFLARMRQGSVLINASRGDLVVEKDLLNALEQEHLHGAFLDVTSPEPPPLDSSLWHHPGIRLTPHSAAATIPETAVAQIAAALEQLDRGERPAGYVDPDQGY
ncbi:MULTISPECIES: 2-hydroxyacid dehydrogenase [unclassified Haematospirillum]|uniref:2-hydroxyacid dehydrogenase n=1 Tax=unclassified Haematospirillum TaxID=2622088 RepID=UPI00143BDA4D|nr:MULTISPECIES: glyoxylate/hydroxypyruvate reductase A [unclassified Haematospirillum]NKD54818.1 glyoxylate/hydroxypyruvate reductase A [Haematospirillum sp. H4890]NKD74656.1 glyoxylate/hydroxypyruvate reductase A [Haematospirillum sp. H4485]NKD87458.1 glyoxylate/hydroxypyruvate reductase A [Haematospirillum sp. 15-248]